MQWDRELMQQALDALEGYARNCRCEGGGAPCDAAEALRARLEKWTADDTAYRPGGLPQEEQELVAWSRVNMNDHKEGDLGIGTVKWDASSPLVVHPHPAFQTTEPQREWQGLTTQEIADETDIATSSNKDIFDIRKAFWCGARWAEAKLKGKNA